jgi:hypothetical protein
MGSREGEGVKSKGVEGSEAEGRAREGSMAGGGDSVEGSSCVGIVKKILEIDQINQSAPIGVKSMRWHLTIVPFYCKMFPKRISLTLFSPKVRPQ